MFERLGGAAARDAAQAFWTSSGPAAWSPYNTHCRDLYNTTPQPADARQRTVFNEDILFTSARGEQQTMNLLPGLARVQCPVLALAGEQDPVTPLQDAQVISAAIPAPCGRLVTFANAGRGVWRDEPDAVMAVLREFVAG